MKTRFAIPLLIAALLQLQGCTTAIVAGTVTAVNAVNDPRSIGSQIDDSTIEVKALIELMKNDGLSKHTHLNVISYNGAVLVVGQAPNQFLVDSAIKILGDIKGVKKVHNQITLGTPVPFTAKTNDTWITTKVKTDLLTDDNVRGHNIKVVTENKVVYLMGLIDAEEAALAAQVAAQVYGVEQVITVFENN